MSDAEKIDVMSLAYMSGRVDCMSGVQHKSGYGYNYDAGYAYQYELEQKQSSN